MGSARFRAFQGTGESPVFAVGGISRFRHFHGPTAGSWQVAKSLRLACCMRRAASVSLRRAAMRSKPARESPGRSDCAAGGKASRVSSGV